MIKENKGLMVSGLSIVGAVLGILVAIKRKSGFWGGLGWCLLLSTGAGGVGYIVVSVIPTTDSADSEKQTV